MKIIKALFCLALLAAAVTCNIDQEMVNGLRGMVGTPVDANTVMTGCAHHHDYFTLDFAKSDTDIIASLTQSLTWLKSLQTRNLLSHLKELKYSRRSVSMTFENHITTGVSGVLARGMIAERRGDRVVARAAYGASTCDMRQQYNIHTWEDCQKLLFIKLSCTTRTQHIPRGFFPHELESALNSLQYLAAKTMLDVATGRTGLSSDHNDLSDLYIQESHTLRRFFPEIKYDYVDMSDVPLNDLPSVLSDASSGEITDGYIFQRVMQVASSADRSSYFHVPNHNLLFVIAINREGSNYQVRLSSFRVDGRLPAGAFATSSGNWNLERGGEGSNPSVHDILNVFPALK